MSASSADHRTRLDDLARRFDMAADEYPGVDAIVFFRLDLRDEQLQHEARTLLVPPPNPAATALEAERNKRRDADGNVRVDDEYLALLRGPYAKVDFNEEIRKRTLGEHAAISAAMDWEKLIPPGGRLGDENSQVYWRNHIDEHRESNLRRLWQFFLVGPPLGSSAIAARRFEMLARDALVYVLGGTGRGNSPVSSWLIDIADREEPLRSAGWTSPAGFSRDQRRVLDWSSLLGGTTPMWRCASQPAKGGGRALSPWWAARLPNTFWLSALSVRHALESSECVSQTTRTNQLVDGPSLAKALGIEAIQNDGKLADGKKLTVTELLRRLNYVGVTVNRTAMYENKQYEGVRSLLKPLKLFTKLPTRRRRNDAARPGSKNKATGQIEAIDHREAPPDRMAR